MLTLADRLGRGTFGSGKGRSIDRHPRLQLLEPESRTTMICDGWRHERRRCWTPQYLKCLIFSPRSSISVIASIPT